MLRYLLDEHVAHAIALGLSRRGVEAVTLTEAGLLTKPDAEIMAYAQRRSYVIVTNDDDYLGLAASGVSHAGIAYWKLHSRTIGEVVRQLLFMSGCLDATDMENRIEFL